MKNLDLFCLVFCATSFGFLIGTIMTKFAFKGELDVGYSQIVTEKKNCEADLPRNLKCKVEVVKP